MNIKLNKISMNLILINTAITNQNCMNFILNLHLVIQTQCRSSLVMMCRPARRYMSPFRRRMVMTLSAAAGAWYLAHGFFHIETALPLVPSYALGGMIGGRVVLHSGDRILKPLVAVLSGALALSILSGWSGS